MTGGDWVALGAAVLGYLGYCGLVIWVAYDLSRILGKRDSE